MTRSITKYALTLLGLILALLAGFGGFNLLVDPYDVIDGPAIDGFNARKTRTHEDGGRITASHRIVVGGMGSAVFGSSRTVDGFPRFVDDWRGAGPDSALDSGGLTNVGVRGSNAFELSRALTLAAHDPDFRCAVVGLDLDELGDHGKAAATYWVTALPDGSRLLGLARMALSPNTFARSVQTIVDNATGGGPDWRWSDEYEPGWQRGRFTGQVPGSFAFSSTYTFDPEREDYLDRTIDRLTERGVQVIGFLHPQHAWREEVWFAAGRGEDFLAFRRDMAALFDRYADRQPADACIEGGAAVLWDFSGFQDFQTTPAPGPEQTRSHPYFYEPAHYLPVVGEAILARLQGEAGEGVFAADRFGFRLTEEIARETEDDLLQRRSDFLARPENAALIAALEAVIEEDRTYRPEQRQFLNRDDWRVLERDLARIPERSGVAGDDTPR